MSHVYILQVVCFSINQYQLLTIMMSFNVAHLLYIVFCQVSHWRLTGFQVSISDLELQE